MKGKWVPIEEKTLLDAFEEEPSLYSDSDANYYNKSFKEEAWNRIIDKVQKIKPVTKSEVKNKIHNMKKKYVKLQQNALKGYPDNWEWTPRIKNLFHDLDIKNVILLDQNNASLKEEEEDEDIYIQFPPDDDNLSDISEHLLQDESTLGNDTYYDIRPKRKRTEQEEYTYQNNDLGSHNTKQRRKKNANNIQMDHQAAAAAPQQQIIMEQMTHHFGLFVESQLNLVNDQVKKNEIIFKLTNCLLDETTKFLKGN